MMLKFLLSCLNSPQSLPSVALMGSVLIVDQPRERGSGFITLLKLPCFVLGKALFNRTVWSVLYSEIVQYTCEQTSEHASWAWFEITRQCDSRQNFVAQSLIASSLHPYETGQYYHLITGFWSVPVCYWYSWFEFHSIFHLLCQFLSPITYLRFRFISEGGGITARSCKVIPLESLWNLPY